MPRQGVVVKGCSEKWWKGMVKSHNRKARKREAERTQIGARCSGLLERSDDPESGARWQINAMGQQSRMLSLYLTPLI